MRVYGLLLRAYPPRFRAAFAEGMRHAFVEERGRARARGSRALAAFWIATIVETIWFGMTERWRRRARLSAGWGASLLTVDWRDAWRASIAAPGVTAIAVLSLALGIGANTAMFAIVDGLVLKRLPVHEPERLAVLDDGEWTNPIWEQIRARQDRLFEGAFAWSGSRFDLSEQGATDFADGSYASGRIFDVLGVRAALGRTFTEADDVRGGGPDGPVVVISDRFWQTRFGGAADVIGRRLTLQRVPFTIIGVLPASFFGADVGRTSDVIVPLADEAIVNGKESALDQRLVWWLNIMMRLKPGQTIDRAAAALRGEQPQIREATLPQGRNAKNPAGYLADPFALAPAATGRSPLRTRYQEPLLIMMAVVASVLLIACANIANLMLARATARRPELSLRHALGASRARLARQLLAESLILAAAGTFLGIIFAHWWSALLLRQLGTPGSVTLDLSFDARMIAFTTVVGLAATLIFGVGPALGAARLAAAEALKEQGRGATGDPRMGIRNALIVAQVALSLALTVGAALFVRTFVSLNSFPLGFDPEPLMVAGVNTRRSPVAPQARGDLYERLREAAAAVPGVASASVSELTPVSGSAWNGFVRSGPPDLTRRQRMVWINKVSPGWFATYGMRLIAGRDFDSRDRAGAEQALVVNESFARRFFNGENPVGRDVHGDLEGPEDERSYRIVGVVNDAVYRSARAGLNPAVYMPVAQGSAWTSSISLTVRAAAGPPARLAHAVGDALLRVEPRASFTFRPITAQIRGSLAQERLLALLSGFFGALALLLAALGLYGVTAYSVNRRRAEIGVRIALGADAAGVVRLVLRRVLLLVGAGVAVGAGLTIWAGRFIGSLLYNLGPRDPISLIAAAGVLTAVGLLAGWLPARRAARADPMRVLRDA